MIKIHEFSTRIIFEGQPENWFVTGYSNSLFMNSTLKEIPLGVHNAIRDGLFDVGEEWEGKYHGIIGSEVNYYGDTFSLIAVISKACDDKGRRSIVYRYFLSNGLGKLPDILFWYTEIANEPVFNPFDTKDIGESYLYDNSLTKIDDSIPDQLKQVLKEKTPVIVPHNQQYSIIHIHQLACQKTTNNGLIAWTYRCSARNHKHYKIIYPENLCEEQKLRLLFRVSEKTSKVTAPVTPRLPTPLPEITAPITPRLPKLTPEITAPVTPRLQKPVPKFKIYRSIFVLLLSVVLLSLLMSIYIFKFILSLIPLIPIPPLAPLLPILPAPIPPISQIPTLESVVLLGLLFIRRIRKNYPTSLGICAFILLFWLIKNNLFEFVQIIFCTISICITPTITYWFTQHKSHITHSLLESLVFIVQLIAFSCWMFGFKILGSWMISMIVLILSVEIGSNIIEMYKVSTLERIAEELTFENIQNEVNEIEKLFKNELAIYSSLPLGMFFGTLLGIIYDQGQLETLMLSFKIILILASAILIYFLFISFERMSDSLFKESDISSPKLQKENKGLLGWFNKFNKFYRLIAPFQSSFKQEDKDIEIASIVSDLRKIYLYDAIHNGLLLIVVAILFNQLYGINLVNQNFVIITIITWILIAIILNLLPYAIGQASLHNKILKKYKGIKRIEMLEKLRRSSPLLPLISFLYTGSDNGILNLRDFLFNPIWNSPIKKMLSFMEENERQRNKLLKEMAEKPTFDLRGSQISGGIAGQDYTGDIIHNYAPNKNLAEAAKEIQQLLDQLSETYPANSTNEKIVVATKALEEIEKNKPLVKRILSAFKAGGSSALEQSLSHPAASFLINFIKDWQGTTENQTK